MSTNILFVFEGERTEDLFVESLRKNILNKYAKRDVIVTCAFKAEVYQLYRAIEADEDLDIFCLIKDRPSNQAVLDEYNRDDFAEIYLFFDYDGHSTLASSGGDEKLRAMLGFFDNETDKGKLYISYPMVEALRHITDCNTFQSLQVKCKGSNCAYIESCEQQQACMLEPHYKNKVSRDSIPQLCNVNSYTACIWRHLIKAHLWKMNYIVNGVYEHPQSIESQLSVFTKQYEKYINKKCPEVAVLSAFPLFVHDYYGNEKTKELLA